MNKTAAYLTRVSLDALRRAHDEVVRHPQTYPLWRDLVTVHRSLIALSHMVDASAQRPHVALAHNLSDLNQETIRLGYALNGGNVAAAKECLRAIADIVNRPSWRE
jgi:hypothetical protein